MAIYVKVNDVEYPASIAGKVHDKDWDDRESKTISLEIPAEEAKVIFEDGIAWSIIQRDNVYQEVLDENGDPVLDENGEPTFEEVEQVTEWDNSEFSVAGDVIDHRDDTCAVKMGKPTDLEEAYEMIYGGDE